MRSFAVGFFLLTVSSAFGQVWPDAEVRLRQECELHIRYGEFAEALPKLREYAQLRGGGESAAVIAVCYARLGQESKGREYLESMAVQADTAQISARCAVLGRMYARCGRHAEALTLYKQAAEQTPEYRLDRNLPVFKWDKTDETAELHALAATAANWASPAVSDWLYEQAISLAPTDDELRFAYVYTAMQRGRYHHQKALPAAKDLYRKSAHWKAMMDRWVPKVYFPYDES